MRTFLFFLIIQISACSSGEGQTKHQDEHDQIGYFGFYNVENLFDTADDPDTFDEDFTPNSEKQWTEERYQAKLEKIASVIGLKNLDFPVFFGLCEVENSIVLEDLVRTPPLKKRMKFILEEGNDGRGIDVAFLYDRKRFTPLESRGIDVPMPEDERPTRKILYIRGMIDDSGPYHIFINHWPSRNGGAGQTERKRLIAAEILKKEIDAVLEEDSNAHLIVMGDFNDYPENKSIEDVLDARSHSSDGLLVNLMAGLSKTKRGSYNYRGDWGFLDQIIVSRSLLNEEKPLIEKEFTTPYFTSDMIYQGKRDEKPNKTYGGINYYGGYSDHLPVISKLIY
jgi:hypothetical protein